MPIIMGCSIVNNLPLQLSVNIVGFCYLAITSKIFCYKDYCIEMGNTNLQYDAAIEQCKDIFLKKVSDYGTAWRVLRTISVVDQIFIKALRIRTIQDKKQQRVGDDITSEFKGIVNYAVIGLVQLELNNPQVEDLPVQQVSEWYAKQVNFAKSTMLDKNHDYGEA